MRRTHNNKSSGWREGEIATTYNRIDHHLEGGKALRPGVGRGRDRDVKSLSLLMRYIDTGSRSCVVAPGWG